MIRNVTLFLILVFVTSAYASESSSLKRMKSWTHVNGKSAMLELLDCKGDWVKFRRADGKVWTMPINNLVKEDQKIIVDLYKQASVRVSLTTKQDLDSVRSSFENLKSDEPNLYNRLNAIAEYPMEDYDIQVNDEGVYYLQFMLKQGAAVDTEAEAMLASVLNAANFGDAIKFELRQIPQDDEMSGEINGADDTMFSPPAPVDQADGNGLPMDLSLDPGMSDLPMEMDLGIDMEMSIPEVENGCGCMTAPLVSDAVYYAPCTSGPDCCATTSGCCVQADCCYQTDCCHMDVCWEDNCCYVDPCATKRRGLFARLFRRRR